MDDVNDLVVTPFRDIVDKGCIAVENAGDTQPMLKAAQSLVKEGQRALKRIEPLCKKHLDEYGINFLVALKENDDIANYRSELTDLLWEFDDFIELQDFDADKFAELQALSRKAAPRIYDILMRMKLETPPLSLEPSFPPLSSPTTPTTVLKIQTQTLDSTPETRLQPTTVQEATEELRRLALSELGPDDSLDAEHREPQHVPEPTEKPPQPPSANPWGIGTPPPTGQGQSLEGFSFQRREPVASARHPDEPVSPSSPLEAGSLTMHPLDASIQQAQQPSQEKGDERRPSPPGLEAATYGRSYSIFPGQSPRSKNSNASSFTPPIIPENAVSHSTSTSAAPHQLSRPDSLDSNPSSVFDNRRADGGSIAESDRRSSAVSAAPTSPTLGSVQLSPTFAAQQSGLEVVRNDSVQESDYGPIPVETERETLLHLNSHKDDCSLNSTSSFYIHKGFCEGAQDVLRGGIGVRKTKKPVGFTTAATVARCLNCFYELDFKEMELDLNNQDEGNFTKSGVGFRVRFLQKSHIATKRVDEVLYGCVFCVHQGRTTYSSDATVFFNQKALFQHLARHPRPLPAIPGFIVIDQPDMPEDFKNNYDIHFKSPVESHPAADMADEIALMPTGTARDNARRMYGQRLLFDRTPALELMQAAKITGIMWPPKYQGDWAFGWHDGVYASIPTEIIKLDAPPASDVKMGGTSLVRASARWKFNPKEKGKGDWLKFDKGEVITNISWPYPDYWCWSGTNSRGKWGIFPQVFIDTNTVKELSTSASDRASILSNEKNRSLSVLSRFATRKSSGRPPSISESPSSQEVPTAALPTTTYRYTRGG